MAFPILGTPKPAFFDSSGAPLANGTLTIQEPADDTNKASYPTYDDAQTRTDANANPLTLNARGEPPDELWGLDTQDYKVVLKDSNGATVWTVDDIFLPSIFPQSSSITPGRHTMLFAGGAISAVIGVQSYTRNATVVEDRTLLASASATTLNNNNVLAALIADLQQKGILP